MFVLRCLSERCDAFLAYEVDRNNRLYVDLAWTARLAGGLRYLPCPKCGGKNVVEEVRDDQHRLRQEVTRFVA